MTSQELMPPAWIRGRRFPPEADRQVVRVLRRQPGVQGPEDLRVTATVPPSLQVQVASGRCIIDGTVDTLQQGSYACTAADSRLLDVPVSDANQATVHRVVAIVDDQDFGGAAYGWDRRLIAGSPGQEAPGVPENAIPLARVAMPAGAVSVGAGQITDDRNRINPILALFTHTHTIWPWAGEIAIPRTEEMLVQAANATGTTDGAGRLRIDYPEHFTTALVSIQCQPIAQDITDVGPGGLRTCVPYGFDASGFSVVVWRFYPDIFAYQNSAITISYLAVGW